MPRRIRARSALARAAALVASAALLALATTGCARKMMPSGGPPDIEPPRIVATEPDSAAAGVARDVRPTITFDESMEPRSSGDAVELAPRVDIRQRRWAGRALTLVFAESLRANQTYTLFVGSSARDRHGNPLAAGRTVSFTTAPAFPPGRIEGTVEAVGFAAAGTYLWCYPEGHDPDSTARDFDALGLADDQGEFRIVGLTPPGRYRIWAFADLNRNRSFEPLIDLLAPADTIVPLTVAAPVARGITLHVTNPRAPGMLAGAVLDTVSTAEGSLRLIVISERDSLRKLLYEVDERGGFRVTMDPGTYRIRAFRDADRNKIWKRDSEGASEEQRIVVAPAGKLENLVFVLQQPRSGGGP